LMDLARQRIRDVVLPAAPALRTEGFRSVGRTCEVCSQFIAPGSPLICIHWESPGESHEAPLHPICHAVWLTLVTEHFTAR